MAQNGTASYGHINNRCFLHLLVTQRPKNTDNPFASLPQPLSMKDKLEIITRANYPTLAGSEF